MEGELLREGVNTKHRRSNNNSMEEDSILTHDEIDMSAFGHIK